MTTMQTDPVETLPPTHQQQRAAAVRQASIRRKAGALGWWLLSQRTEPRGAGRWVVVFSEVEYAPPWWRGAPLVGEDVVAAVEVLADREYVVRRVERAGDRVRRVEVFVR